MTMLIIEKVMDANLSQLRPGDQLISYNGIDLSDEQSLKHAIWRGKVEKIKTVDICLIREGRGLAVEVVSGPLDLIFMQPKSEPIPEAEPEAELEAEPEPEPSVIESIAGWGGHKEKPRHDYSESEAEASKTNAFGLGSTGDAIQFFPKPLKERDEDRYDVARGVCNFVGVFGWILVFVGVVTAAISINAGIGVVGVLVAASPIVTGLMTVMITFVAMAVFDIADNSRETRRMTAEMLDKRGED